MAKRRKITRRTIGGKQQAEMRAWSLLIPRIEDALKLDIKSEWKCVLIEYEIQKERRR